MIDPIGGLIAVARKKVLSGRSEYTAVAANCTCEVVVAALSAPQVAPLSKIVTQSTRERYSRCVEHLVR